MREAVAIMIAIALVWLTWFNDGSPTEQNFPPEDYYIENPGSSFIKIPKGFFNNKDNFLTEQEMEFFKENLGEYFEWRQEQQRKKDETPV